MPPCDAPMSLSVLAVIRSAPAATDSRRVGSFSNPKRDISTREPAPTSSIKISLCAFAIATISSSETSAVNPEIL